MITRLAEHWVRPECVEDAKAIFAEWGRVARTYPGLLFRQVIQSEKDPLKITTITTWESLEDSDRWHDSPEHAKITWYHHERLHGREDHFTWHRVEVDDCKVLSSGRTDPLPEL